MYCIICIIFYALYSIHSIILPNFKTRWHRQTDRPTDRPTDIVTYRAAIAAKNSFIFRGNLGMKIVFWMAFSLLLSLKCILTKPHQTKPNQTVWCSILGIKLDKSWITVLFHKEFLIEFFFFWKSTLCILLDASCILWLQLMKVLYLCSIHFILCKINIVSCNSFMYHLLPWIAFYKLTHIILGISASHLMHPFYASQPMHLTVCILLISY